MKSSLKYKLNEQELLNYFENNKCNNIKPGLERTKNLLRKFKNPEKSLKFIHIAGTNGKGSILAMLYSILINSGYKVGFYLSPHLVNFRERIQVNGEYISRNDLERIGNIVISAADLMDEHPTCFEIVTVIGMLYFKEQNCDIVLLETGMGGGLDSTNVIDNTEVSIIANIGIDHIKYLGNSLEKIAEAKAGIFKPGGIVVAYDNVSAVKIVLNRMAHNRGCKIYYPAKVCNVCQNFDNSFNKKVIKIGKYSLDNRVQSFYYNGEIYNMNLLGEYQLKNVSVVIACIDILRKKGWGIHKKDVLIGLSNINWPARFQIMHVNPYFILDGGHNAQCAVSIIDNIKKYFSGNKVVFIFGIMIDKDIDAIIDILLPYAKIIICAPINSCRAIDPCALETKIQCKAKKQNMDCLVCHMSSYELYQYISIIVNKTSGKQCISNVVNNHNNIDLLLKNKNILLMPHICFGSLYLAGNIIKNVFE